MLPWTYYVPVLCMNESSYSTTLSRRLHLLSNSNLKAAERATETPETQSEATAPPAAESETSPSTSLGLARRKAELMRLILGTR